MATHVKVIAVLCLIFGGFGVLASLFSSVIFSALATLDRHARAIPTRQPGARCSA